MTEPFLPPVNLSFDNIPSAVINRARAASESNPLDRLFIDPNTGRVTKVLPKNAIGFRASGLARLEEGSKIFDETFTEDSIIKKAFTSIGTVIGRTAGSDNALVLPDNMLNNADFTGVVVAVTNKETGQKEFKDGATVSTREMFESFNRGFQLLLLQNGFDPDTLSINLRISNANEFARRWPDIFNRIKGAQALKLSAENAPVRNTLAAIESFGLELFDPAAAVSIGASVLPKLLSKTVLKGAVRKSIVRLAVTGTPEQAAEQLFKITGRRYVVSSADDAAEQSFKTVPLTINRKPIPSVPNSTKGRVTLTVDGETVTVVGANAEKDPKILQLIEKGAQTVSEGAVISVAKAAAKSGRPNAARNLVFFSGAGFGGTFGAAFDYGAQSFRFEFGQQDPTEGLELPIFSAVSGGLLGTILSSFAVRGINGSFPLTNRSYRRVTEGTGIYNLGSEVISRLERANPKYIDQPIDVKHMASVEAAEAYANVLYTKGQRQELEEYAGELLKVKLEDSTTAQTLANYLAQLPTHKELIAFLKKGEDGLSELDRAVASGKLPDTDMIRAQRNIWKRTRELEDLIKSGGDAKKIKAARLLLRVTEEERLELLKELKLDDVGITEKVDGLVTELRGRAKDIPVASFRTHEERVDKLVEIMTDEKVLKSSPTTSILPFIQKVMGKLGANVGNPGMHARAAMASDNPKLNLLGRMMTLFDGTKHTPDELLTDSNGVSIVSAQEGLFDVELRHTVPFQEEYYPVMSDLSPEVADERDINIMQAAAGVAKPHSTTTSLVKRFRAFFDYMGSLGLANGTLRNKVDNYVPTYPREQMPEGAEKVVIASARKRLGAQFTTADSSDVHHNTLARLGYLEKDPNEPIHSFSKSAPSDYSTRIDEETGEMLIPRTVSEINEKYRKEYKDALPDGLDQEAELIVWRWQGKGFDTDPDAVNDIRTPYQGKNANSRMATHYVKSDKAKRIEQDVFLDTDVLKSGAVETDPNVIMEMYMRGIGYDIIRNEALRQVFGQNVDPRVFFDAVRRIAGDDQQARDLVKSMVALDKVTARRLSRRSEGATAAFTIGGLSVSAALAKIVPSILLTELGAITILRAATKEQAYINFLKNMKDFAKNFQLSRNYAQSIGVERAIEASTSRFLADSGSHLNAQLRKNHLIRGVQGLIDAIRIVTLERPLTNATKTINYNVSFGELWASRRMFDKIISGNYQRISTLAEDKAAARELGMSVGLFRKLKSFGLLDPKVVSIAKRIHSLDNLALSDPDRLRSVIQKLDGNERELALELDRRLRRMARNDADQLIATPSAITKTTSTGSVSDNPWFQMVTQFTSWLQTFQVASVGQLQSASHIKQATMVGAWLTAEMLGSIVRNVIYNEMSVDEAIEQWEEKPIQKFAELLLRTPLTGAFSVPASVAQMFLSTNPRASASDAFSSPPLNHLDNLVRASRSIANSIIDGDEISPSASRAIWNNVPPFDIWYFRAVPRAFDGFESKR